MIGYDRYNVLVNGMNGRKVDYCTSVAMVVFAVSYATLFCGFPMLRVWGSYKLGIEMKSNTTGLNY